MTDGFLTPAPIGSAMRVLADGLDHPEGVTYDPDAGVLWAGGEDGQLYRIDPADGAVQMTIGAGAGMTLGLAVDGAGRVIACAPGRGAVVVFEEGRLRRVVEEVDGRALVLPNYPCFGPDGALFVTDSGSWGRNDGRLIRVDTDGSAHVLSAGLERFPNGLAISPDGATLWCVESFSPTLSRIDLAGDGRAEVVLRLDGTVPDGLALTQDGGLVISLYRPDRILHLDRHGRLTVVADDPQGTLLSAPTNVCFVGPRLISANLGRWHLTAIETDLRGVAPHRPAVWAVDR